MILWCPDTSIACRMRERGLPPMRKGDKVPGHAHGFGHITFVPVGGFLFKKFKKGVVIREAEIWAEKPMPFIWIERGTEHELTCLQDGSEYYCMYAHREPEEGAVVMEHVGWSDSYS